MSLDSLLGHGVARAADHRTAPVTMPAAKPLADSLTGAAKQSYGDGMLLFRASDYAGAFLKFEQAYAQSHDPRLLWNQAACQQQLRHYSKALVLLQRYQGEGAAFMDDAERERTNKLVQTMQGFVSRLSVQVNEPGAEISVDGERIGVSPLPETLIDMGSRRVRVEKPGFQPYEEEVPVSGGGNVELSVTLVRDVHEGRLIVNAGSADDIAIDGQPVARAHWEGRLASGGHQLKISAPGMRTYQSEVVIQDNAVRRVDITLETQPHAAVSPLLWVAGGVVAAAGLGLGAYFLFKPSDKEGTAPRGTLEPYGWVSTAFRTQGSF